MKRIIFYTERLWAFGTIHYSLVKLLYQRGINAEVLDFYVPYTVPEMMAIQDTVDYFVTTPVGVGWLLNYGIVPEKIKSIAHAQWDILLSNSQIGTDIYHKLAGYAVVSNILKQKSQEFGVSRTPAVTHLGIEFDRFYRRPQGQLKTVGFAGAFESRNFAGEEIKRGRLVQQVCAELNLPLAVPKHHYLAMPKYYQGVDAVIMASTEEGAGLPMMEAAAAGKVTMGTPVGYYAENPAHVGIHLPLNEQEFVAQCSDHMHQIYNDSDLYLRLCTQNQEYARAYYDWSHHIDAWVNFLQ
jgi:glycosyltransferase involved in cell wall biosynthesis